MTKRFYGNGGKGKLELFSLADDIADQEVAGSHARSKLADGVPGEAGLARIAKILKDDDYTGKHVAFISRNTLPPGNDVFEQKSRLESPNAVSQNYANKYEATDYTEQQALELLDLLDSLEID